MRVIQIPFDVGNPYQRLLVENLEDFGVHTIKGRYARLFSWLDLTLLVNFFREPKVDVIHLHWLHGFLLTKTKIGSCVKASFFLFQVLLLRLLGIKFVWTVHNLKNHENTHHDLEFFFTRLVVRLMNHIIVHCDDAGDKVVHVFGAKKNKISIVPHGNYIGCYPNNLSRDKARDILGFPDDKFIYLFLGMIRPYKGVVELMNTFRQVDSLDALLVIAGNPKDPLLRSTIEEKSQNEENIFLRLEKIPDQEIQLYMNAANVVVCPYLDILNSGAVILAASFGRAVVAPVKGCIPYALCPNSSFIYDDTDSQEDGLGVALRSALAAGRKYCDELGKKNFHHVRQFDWKGIAGQTSNIYKAVNNPTGTMNDAN